MKYGHIATDSGYTYGGYSGSQTANRKYVLRIPYGYPLEVGTVATSNSVLLNIFIVVMCCVNHVSTLLQCYYCTVLLTR